jgi:hypothetical protein
MVSNAGIIYSNEQNHTACEYKGMRAAHMPFDTTLFSHIN